MEQMDRKAKIKYILYIMFVNHREPVKNTQNVIAVTVNTLGGWRPWAKHVHVND